MEQKTVTIPFDLETAKRINIGGIDLCECGSGARVGECECGSQKAHDTLGIKYDSFGAILKNFG